MKTKATVYNVQRDKSGMEWLVRKRPGGGWDAIARADAVPQMVQALNAVERIACQSQHVESFPHILVEARHALTLAAGYEPVKAGA